MSEATIKLAIKKYFKERFNLNEAEMELTEIYNLYFFHRNEELEQEK